MSHVNRDLEMSTPCASRDLRHSILYAGMSHVLCFSGNESCHNSDMQE